MKNNKTTLTKYEITIRIDKDSLIRWKKFRNSLRPNKPWSAICCPWLILIRSPPKIFFYFSCFQQWSWKCWIFCWWIFFNVISNINILISIWTNLNDTNQKKRFRGQSPDTRWYPTNHFNSWNYYCFKWRAIKLGFFWHRFYFKKIRKMTDTSNLSNNH